MVSDYLQDAPEEVLESIATTIMTRIKGEEDGSYSEPTIDYLTSEEFLDRNQPLYV